MILRISNWTVETVTDGGSSRDLALVEFALQYGGKVEVIRNEFFFRSKVHRVLRIIQLIGAVISSSAPFVLLYYPGYPFFWKHKATPWFFVSLAFTIMLHFVVRLQRKHIIIDVVDLPLYQFRDLCLPMEMSKRTFHIFDRIVFSCADQLWLASSAFAEILLHEYRIPADKLKIVPNGAFRLTPGSLGVEKRIRTGSPLRFVYAGTMNSARELDAMLQAFVNLSASRIELHLCGIEGEWIAEKYPDPRIKFYGFLDQPEVLALLRQCDIGIVPYPERGYYNYVFPSKLPFYIVGGVMVLGSDATELASRIDEWQIGIHGSLERIQELMQHCADHLDEVSLYQEKVHSMEDDFYWDNIYARALRDAAEQFAVSLPHTLIDLN